MARRLDPDILTFSCLVVLLLVPLSLIQPDPLSDFPQDFLSAKAVWAQQDPLAPTAQLAREHGVPAGVVTAHRNAHPPTSILFALPFARLEWPAARLAFLVFSWMVIAWTIVRSRLSHTTQIAFLLPLLMGLFLGAMEPILFGLIAAAMRHQDSSPRITAACLGAAIALKIYPLVLLYGLLSRRHRDTLLLTSTAVGAFLLLTTLALGPHVWLDWIAYNDADSVPACKHKNLPGELIEPRRARRRSAVQSERFDVQGCRNLR